MHSLSLPSTSSVITHSTLVRLVIAILYSRTAFLSQSIAEVTKAVAKGDLSRKIEIEAQGEIAELKTTINVMVGVSVVSLLLLFGEPYTLHLLSELNADDVIFMVHRWIN